MLCRKKQIVLVALAVMICVAGYLNWRYDDNSYGELDDYLASVQEQEQEQTTDDASIGQAKMVNADVPEENDYFAECRLSRETARSESIELLKETFNSTAASAEAKAEAEDKIFEVSQNMENEVNIENLIKSKGFEDAVVFINGDTVTVTVKSQKLTAPEAARIKDIVAQYVDAKEVKIIEVE